MIGDGEIRAKEFESVIVELFGIIRDDYPWDPKSANDIFPNKIFNVSFSDFGEKFRFYPLGEVIYGENKNFSLSWSLRQRSTYVYPH